MANRIQAFDKALKTCYDLDLDWDLLPQRMKRVSIILLLLLTSILTLHDEVNAKNRYNFHFC